MEEKFADVIIDISHEKVDRPFLYKIPEPLWNTLEVGMCVRVPFGRGNNLREGYVMDIKETSDYPIDKLKEIAEIVPASIPAEARSIQLAWWIKTHYGSTMIAAMKAVLPVKQKMKAATYKEVTLEVTRREAFIMRLEAYRKNQMGKVRLLDALLDGDGASIGYTMLTGKLSISPQTIKSLEEKKIVRVKTYQSYRNPIRFDHLSMERKELTPQQNQITDSFLSDYDNNILTPALLHGITGSGKTEVYMELIEGMINRGKETIVLIPEIALTYQTVLRFYKRFGDIVSVMNSKLSAGEKFDQFERARTGDVKIMIGPRSALFTPFENLGLIIIDEEHESSYKSDSMPKYHAREVAVHLAEMTNACVFMGSATPSIEANYRALKGEYRKYLLTDRIGEAMLPMVYTVDLREELKSGNTSIFSRRLQESMQERLDKKEQIMLFLNRRGVAGFVSCRACGHVLKCPHCDVSLSEHRNRMICHYCGYETAKVTKCPECGSKYIFGFKAGTQQVEDKVKEMFPKARVLRMDADTTKKKDDYENILSAFSNEEADILIGTQMIVKGHDFKNVTLVGILAADLSLHASDYRAAERTFQLLTQAVGRAGRDQKPGEAIIQTYEPDHYSIQYSVKQDYNGFYQEEIAYRDLMEYPPVSHMLAILMIGKQENQTASYANRITRIFKGEQKADSRMRVIGPAPASIGKINDFYRQVTYVKSSLESDLIQVKNQIENYLHENADEFKYISVYFDFDPVNGY